MEVNEQLNLSAASGNNLVVVQAVQGDTDRKVTVRFDEFRSLSGATCVLYAKRPTGSVAKINGTVSGATAVFDIKNAITMAGDVYAQVQLRESNGRLSSFDFVIQVSATTEAMATAKEIYWVESFVSEQGAKVDAMLLTKGTAFDTLLATDSDRFDEFLEDAEDDVEEAIGTIDTKVDEKFAAKITEITGYVTAAQTAKTGAEAAQTAAETASSSASESATNAFNSAEDAEGYAAQAQAYAEAVPAQVAELKEDLSEQIKLGSDGYFYVEMEVE